MTTHLDTLLANWPLAPESEADADARHLRIMAAIGSPAGALSALSDEACVAAPLPQVPDEAELSSITAPSAQAPASRRGPSPEGTAAEKTMSNPTDRTRDRQSLVDLAKLATSPSMTPPPPSVSVTRGVEATKDDSGIVDFSALAAEDPGAEARSKTTELAGQGLFDDVPAAAIAASAPSLAKSAPTPAAPSSAAALAPPSASALPVAAVAAPAPAPTDSSKKKGPPMLLLGGGVAMAAAAAAVFFVMRGKPEGVAPHPVETNAPMQATAEAPAVTAPAASAVAAPVAVAEAPAAADTAAKSAASKPGAAAAPVGGKPASVAAAPAGAGVDPKLEFKMPAAATGKAGDLSEEMRRRVGGETGAGMTPAATGGGAGPGNVPQKPSQGQVAGAIAGVLPAARACIGSDDPVVKATVMFKSDGSVQSVSAPGAGAACIKAALSKAKVQPFAEATYSFPVTVRGTN